MKNLLLSLTFLAIASPSWGLGVTAGQITTAKLANGSVTTPKLHLEALDGFAGLMRFTNTGFNGIGTASPLINLQIEGGSMGTFSNEGDPSIFIGDTIAAARHGTINWTSSTDVLSLGTQAGGQVIHMPEDGNVGIGTASPDGTLHAHTATAGSVTPWGDADDLVVENSGAGGISVAVPDASTGNIVFTSPSAPAGIGALISNNYNSGVMKISPRKVGATMEIGSGNAITAVYIATDGDVGIGTASPDVLTHISAGDASVVCTGQLCIESNSGSRVVIASNGGATGLLAFQDAGSATDGSIQYNHSTQELGLFANSGLKITITSDGGFRLYSRTIAQLEQITPGSVGEQYYCTDCTLAGGRAVVSTGTARANFSDADGSDWE